jgi:hypothetical protein
MGKMLPQGGLVNDFAKVTKLATLLTRYAVFSPTRSYAIFVIGWCRIHSPAVPKSN